MYTLRKSMFKNYVFNSSDPAQKHSFDIIDIDISIVNGIRRTILTDIPIPGIIGEKDSTVEIIKNTGGLHNEIISHRIGLLPICLSENETDNYEDNSIQLELNVANNDINLVPVDTSSIKGTLDGKNLTSIQLSKLFPSNLITKSHILITRLKPGEELHFKASVVKKTARYNSAFCPVSLCNFYYNQDPSLIKEEMSILDKERAFIANKYGEASSVKFEIESINYNLSAKYLFNKAIDIIIEKLVNISQNLNSQNSEINVSKYEELENTFQFVINNEDDTIGNIIQSLIHNKYVRENNKIDDIECLYVGYICPHPLKTELLIRITLKDQTNKIAFINYLDKNCKIIIDELSIIKNEWNKFI